MKRRRQRERKRGFTLIELLVVISVIVLLMGLLLPALSHARRQARVVVCQANQRQLAITSWMYMSEDDDNLMDYKRWCSAASPEDHASGRKVFLCPMARRCDDMTRFVENRRGANIGGKFTAWWTNELFSNDPSGFRFCCSSYSCNDYAWGQNSYTAANVKAPSTIPILFDGAWPNCSPLGTDEPPVFDGDLAHDSGRGNSIKTACLDRHGNGTLNVAFADGGSRRVGLKELWTFKWHDDFDTAGPWTKAGGALPGDWPLWMRQFKDY